jgi:hypothetical protein
VVTIYATSLTLKNPTFCPHTVFMCFVWIWEQTAIISQYSTNWLVFITDGECLLRGTDWILQYNSDKLCFLAARALNWTVSRRSLFAEARARCQVSPCEIYGGQSGTVTVLLRAIPFLPVNIIPPILHALLLHISLTGRKKGWNLGTSQ